MTDAQAQIAAKLYVEDGLSLFVLGERFGVHANTMAKELRGAGVTIRPRRGF